MSYSNSFPQQRPTLNLDFANSGKLDSRISYSRSSTATAFSNEKHLSSENLLPYSNDLSQSVWTKRNLTVPATNIVAPDGTSSASSLLETTATSTHDFYEEFSAVSGTSYTFTLYAKANGRDTLHVSPQATSTIASVVFDLTAVTSTVISGSADSHSIAAIGSTGWYKLQVTVTATGSGTGFLQTYFRVGGTTSYAGDATKGAYIWGCQVSSTGETVLNATSGQISREFAPTLKTAAADAPRFEYSASDGQSVGLLIEQQFTQLVQYSEEFDNTAQWTGAGMSIQPNSAPAPDGSLSADLLVEADEVSGNNSHYVRQFVSVAGIAAGQTYTLSIYAKAAGRNHAAIYTSIGGAAAVGIFSLVDGSVTYNNGNGTWSSQDCGNGWFRLQLTFTTVNANNHSVYFYTAQNATTYAYTGNGYGSVLLWGANLTQTASSMSYLKAEGSQTTKSADSCSVDLSQTSYRGGPVSIVAETPAGAGEGFIPYLFSLSGGDQNFYAFKNTTTASASDDWRYQVGGTGTTVSGSAGSDKIAIRWDTADVKAQFSAGVSSTNSGAVETAFTTLKIGMSPANLYQLNGNFKRVSLFNVALSDTELAALVD